MRILNSLLIVLIVILNTACEKDPEHSQVVAYNATVLGGSECGNPDYYVSTIQFDDTVSNLPDNRANGVYTAMNFPKEFEIFGKRVRVEYRELNGERLLCTMFGPSYPSLFITRIEE